MKAKKRWLSLALVVAMLIACLPVQVLAEEADPAVVEPLAETVPVVEETAAAIEESAEIATETVSETEAPEAQTAIAEQVTAAGSKDNISVDIYGDITFTTFEDLQELAHGTYEYTQAIYEGTEPLVIKNDLTLPEGLVLVVRSTLKVPAGVTLTCEYHLYAEELILEGTANCGSAYILSFKVPAGVTFTCDDRLRADEMIVEGTVNCGSAVVPSLTIPAGVTFTCDKRLEVDELIVAGTVNCGILDISKKLSITGTVNCNNSATVTLAVSRNEVDKVNLTGESAYIACECSAVNMADLKKIATIMNAERDSRWSYLVGMEEGTSLILDESVSLPKCCYLVTDCLITIQKGCTLELNGAYMLVGNTLKVNGSLVNNGEVGIVDYDEYSSGKLEINGGTYSGDGVLYVYSTALEAPDTALPGLDLTNFEIEEYTTDYGKEWYLTPKESSHTHSYSSAVTAPTCTEQGYTIYTCACGDSYADDYVPATGEHVYSDDQDAVCDTCGGALRLPTAPEGVDYTPMYRLYNPNSGEHLYTGSTVETENLAAVGWQYEGVAWNAPVSSGEPVYRLCNPNNGDHHYTMSWEEVEMLKEAGWQYEGVCWNSASADNFPLHRLYNPNAECGIHHYTGSTEERDNLVAAGWIYEGLGWYGIV